MSKRLKLVLALLFLLLSCFVTSPALADEDNQTATNSGTFSLSPTQRDPTEYNILPLVLDAGISPSNYQTILANMVAEQGYEAHCAQKKWEINPTVWGTIVEYFQKNSEPQPFRASSTYHANLESARIPLLRGSEASELTDKNDSFEGMFGANLQTVFSEEDYINASGVATRLLSAYDQCYYKKHNLDLVEQLCDKFFFQCFLDKEIELAYDEINNLNATNISYLGVKRELDHFYDNFDLEKRYPDEDNKNAAICNAIYNNEELESVAQTPMASARRAIEAVNIDLDGLYRWAFLILVPRQSEFNNKFSFLENPGGQAGADSPIFLAFKIPNFSTNKSNTYRDFDSLELTKMVLQTYEQNQADYNDQQAARDQLLASANSIDQVPVSNRTIRVDNGDSDLETVLLDIVNAAAPQCDIAETSVIDLIGEDASGSADIADLINHPDINFERAGDIYTPAEPLLVDETARALYKSGLFDFDNEGLARSIESKDETHEFSWSITVANSNPDKGNPVTVNAYLVLPMGESIKDANKSFGIFWSQDILTELVKNENLIDMENKTGGIPKYYTLKDSDVRYESTDSHSWETECREEVVYNDDGSIKLDSLGNPVVETICQKKTFGVTAKDGQDEGVLFPDFGLGWLIRQIQTTIRSTADQAYDYIASCDRVEDLFLGRCSGSNDVGELSAMCDGEAFGKIEGLPEYTNVPQKAKDYFSQFIAPKVSQELVDAYGAAQAATGIPCEILAGIHYMEGGMEPGQSLHDGGALRGTLEEDAISAAEILKDKMGMSNIAASDLRLTYEDLLTGLSYYNGPGNANCTSNENGPRPTRWYNSGWCPVDLYGNDHLYPTNWIDEQHDEMDLIFCMDAVEFTCNRPSQSSDRDAIRTRYESVMGRTPSEEFIDRAITLCFQGTGSYACTPAATNNNSNKYPAFSRPGVLTTAIIMNSFENPILQNADN